MLLSVETELDNDILDIQVEYETRLHKHMDGFQVIVEENQVLIQQRDGFLKDINDLKKQQEKLKDEELRLNSIIEPRLRTLEASKIEVYSYFLTCRNKNGRKLLTPKICVFGSLLKRIKSLKK